MSNPHRNNQDARNYFNGPSLIPYQDSDVVQGEKNEEYRLPRLWDGEIDRLAARTWRAYKLVINYQKDCPTGHRWTPEHIDIIREAGKCLSTDRRVLHAWRKTVRRVGTTDTAMMDKIASEVSSIRNYCMEIQAVISAYEQRVVRHEEPIEVTEYGHPVGIRVLGAAAETRSMDAMEGIGREWGPDRGLHHRTDGAEPSEADVERLEGISAPTTDIVEMRRRTEWAPVHPRKPRYRWDC